MKLSKTQAGVVRVLKERGVPPLVRVRGGFWTYAGCPVNGAGIPEWWTGWGTVLAMERMGVLVRRGLHAEAWRDDRVLDLARVPD